MASPRTFRQLRFEVPAGATELIVVRHGESQASVEGQPCQTVDGHSDPALSDHGRRQAEALGERLGGETIHAVYVSSLCRTLQTATPLASRLGLAPIVERDLREVFLGEWESVFRQKVADGDPIAIRMHQEQRWDVIPGAEPAEEFAARVRGAFDRIAAAHRDERVVVVAHGGTIGELLRQVTGANPFAFVGADNASISHVVATPDRWVLRRFNDTNHL